jgi:drug/metabolite transporter (DMT)-like permease
VILWFFAMTRIPLAEVTAMNYLVPVYVTLGAALFLGERLRLRRHPGGGRGDPRGADHPASRRP